MQDSASDSPTRRSVTVGLIGLAAFAAGAGATALWTRKDMAARLFNPFTLENFALAGVEGLARPNGATVPGFSSEDLKDRRSILNLWASWCPSCRAEHALLVELAARDLAPIYGANIKDKPEHARAFLQQHGNPYRAIGADPHAFLQHALGAPGLPATFVVAPGPAIDVAIFGELDRETVEERIVPALTRMG
jgi:cytochrome c biogenesis protein CcmG, thiol:disulfide interchange protein DsbE